MGLVCHFSGGSNKEVNSTWYPEIEEPIQSRENHYSLALYILIILIVHTLCGPIRVIQGNWRAPWKGGICTYFVAIFQVAWNPLKFGMNVRVFSRTNLHKNPAPPPLLSLFVHLQTMLDFDPWELKDCACVFYAIGGGRGGGLSRTCLRPCFPTCGTQTQGHF